MTRLVGRLNELLAEMKRRSLFRVALSYGVVAWLTVQVASTVFPALHLPGTAVTMVVVLLLLGFPVSLVLAWAYELTPQGVRRDAADTPAAGTPAGHPQVGDPRSPLRPEGPYFIANLPPSPTPFVGRAAEVAHLKQLITGPTCRLLTLTGPGGMGKSRTSIHLARQVADTFRNGVCWVPLSDLGSPHFLATAIAEHLQLAISGRDDRAQLLGFLREKSLLLVLDGFEHLTEGSLLLADILEHAPEVKIVVASRERLNLQAETVFPLDGLEVPESEGAEAAHADAVELFVGSARRYDARFQPTPEDLAHIAEICRGVEGSPLAIELASAWVGTLACSEIVREIRRSYDFLLGAQRDFPERHRSLRAVFESSWRMLSEAERAAFARLAVFHGGFNREAAQRVAGAHLSLLSVLLNKSLIHRAAADHYVIHEILRQYAEDRLREEPAELAWARQLHAAYFVDRLAEMADSLDSPGENGGLADFAREFANIRAAWEWTVQERRIDLIAKSLPAMFSLYRLRGWAAEGEALFGSALAALQPRGSDGSAPEVITRLMLRQGAFLALLGRYEQAQEALEHGLARARAAGSQAEVGFALANLGLVASYRGNYALAEQLLTEGRQTYDQAQDRRGAARAAISLGNVAFARGQQERARELFAASLMQFQELKDLRGTSTCLKNLGGVAFAGKRYAEGKSLLLRSIAIDRTLGDRFNIANSLQNLGCIAFRMGDHSEAERYLEEGITLSREMGFRRLHMFCLNELGNLRQAQGRMDEALALYRQALQIASESEETPMILEILLGFARIRADAEPEEALELLTLVRSHPASDQGARERASELATSIEPGVPPERRRAAVKPEQLPEVVSSLLRQRPAILAPELR